MPGMTLLQIAALYCALNAIVTLVLAINCARTRGKTKVALGDGGNEAMLRAMRAHSNNVEYVPIVLVMLVTLALLQGSAILLHVIGLCLLIGRIAHGVGLATNAGLTVGRGLGIALTLIAMITAIVALLLKVLA